MAFYVKTMELFQRGDVQRYCAVPVRGQVHLLPYIGLDHRNFQLGLTYDIITGDLKRYSPKNGSFGMLW